MSKHYLTFLSYPNDMHAKVSCSNRHTNPFFSLHQN